MTNIVYNMAYYSKNIFISQTKIRCVLLISQTHNYSCLQRGLLMVDVHDIWCTIISSLTADVIITGKRSPPVGLNLSRDVT